MEELKEAQSMAADGGYRSRKFIFSIIIALLIAFLAHSGITEQVVYVSMIGVLMVFIGGNVAIKVVAKMYGIDVIDKLKPGGK